jgi:hypothetical protein
MEDTRRFHCYTIWEQTQTIYSSICHLLPTSIYSWGALFQYIIYLVLIVIIIFRLINHNFCMHLSHCFGYSPEQVYCKQQSHESGNISTICVHGGWGRHEAKIYIMTCLTIRQQKEPSSTQKTGHRLTFYLFSMGEKNIVLRDSLMRLGLGKRLFQWRKLKLYPYWAML